jgi:hypothetical protein
LPERAARTATTGDGANENNNITNVARPQQQRRAGIRMAYIVTLRNVTAGHSAADVHGVRRAGAFDVTADLARSLDRGYEFPPHRGRQFNHFRTSRESEEEEDH